ISVRGSDPLPSAERTQHGEAFRGLWVVSVLGWPHRKPLGESRSRLGASTDGDLVADRQRRLFEVREQPESLRKFLLRQDFHRRIQLEPGWGHLRSHPDPTGAKNAILSRCRQGVAANRIRIFVAPGFLQFERLIYALGALGLHGGRKLAAGAESRGRRGIGG